jgi:uncharacterized protein YndB with AHSA1/START domain
MNRISRIATFLATVLLLTFGAHQTPASEAGAASASPPSVSKRWRDGQVTVSATDRPIKRQDFEVVVPASLERVWDLLATTEGLSRLGGKEPRVDLRPGGAYAFWPDAPNKVLAFVPYEMLATSGSAPETFPNVRKGGTWSAYFLEPLGEHKTRLRLSVLGWRPGEKEWDDAYDYFLKGNAKYLNSVHDVLAGEGAGAGNVLRHEAIIDAQVERVWQAFTTKAGLESWMVPHAEIDLRVGGKMLTTYDPNGVIGDDGTIENTILSYEPLRMLSIKATKPPANFPHKEAIENMWSVLYFEPVGPDRTRVTCVGMGYGDDEASQKLRQHFDWGNAWTLKQLQERFAPKADEEAPKP